MWFSFLIRENSVECCSKFASSLLECSFFLNDFEIEFFWTQALSMNRQTVKLWCFLSHELSKLDVVAFSLEIYIVHFNANCCLQFTRHIKNKSENQTWLKMTLCLVTLCQKLELCFHWMVLLLNYVSWCLQWNVLLQLVPLSFDFACLCLEVGTNVFRPRLFLKTYCDKSG